MFTFNLEERLRDYVSSQDWYESEQGVISSVHLPLPISHICHFFTQAKILDRKFYTEERVNYGKRISRQNSVNCDLLAQANYTNYTLCVKLHTECKSWVSFV